MKTNYVSKSLWKSALPKAIVSLCIIFITEDVGFGLLCNAINQLTDDFISETTHVDLATAHVGEASSHVHDVTRTLEFLDIGHCDWTIIANGEQDILLLAIMN